MKHTPDGYSYKGEKRGKIAFRPFCSAAGTPAVLIEAPGGAILLDLLNVEPFVDNLRAAAAGTRRNYAVTRRPWSPKWTA